ncbi:hypothetical protein Q9L58_008697 [Maublancomyces gigas]|uniref:Uncharacterized protein n=1 Tax=Discina gigas TaxID=1032678 RepID=A0ABR3G9Z9_9PEZI
MYDLNPRQIRRILGSNSEDFEHLKTSMQLYLRTKGIKNKTARHRRLFEDESDEGQYLPDTINPMLIDFAKPKKLTLADGSDDEGGEGEGEAEDEDEGEYECEHEYENVGEDEDMDYVATENIVRVSPLPQATLDLPPAVSTWALAAGDDVAG